MNARRPLEGIKVLDLSRLLPGPFLTMILSDLGADVIKVEDTQMGDYLRNLPPAQAGTNGRFLSVNRDKRSVSLDLKNDAGRGAFLRMAEKADVVVESFRPGVMDRLGVGYPALRERNPMIILCSISGYGQTGPYRDRAGHDLNYIGLAGVLAMGGAAKGAPALPGTQIADLAGGGLWGACGVLGALVGRERTGEGQHLDISMTEGSLALMAPAIGHMKALGKALSRGEEHLNGGAACYTVYRTRDDRWLSVGALEPKFWAAFNTAIGRKVDLNEILLPPEGQARVKAEIQEIIATRTRAEWEAVFAATDACTEPVLELDEVLEHPLHQERRMFFTTPGPGGGEAPQVRTPVGEPAARRGPPTQGQHTREVLAEFGFTDDEVTTLIQTGAAKG